jgi:HAD superfamily hydrolase (TIGR01549 family)
MSLGESHEMQTTRLPVAPRAVIFDLDGLLVDTERLAMQAHAEIARELCVDAPEDFCRHMIGIPADACLALVKDRFGPEFEADDFLRHCRDRLEAFIAKGELNTKTGATDLLDVLDELRLPRAIATSSGRAKADSHLKAAGLRDRFELIVTRDDVARGKPHPDLYLEAARRLGADPKTCLALEDSHNGIRAAHAANMMVIMVPDLLPPTAETRSACVTTVQDLHRVAEIVRDAATPAAREQAPESALAGATTR